MTNVCSINMIVHQVPHSILLNNILCNCQEVADDDELFQVIFLVLRNTYVLEQQYNLESIGNNSLLSLLDQGI